jgi:Cellulase (glycosyl hydrolase family 5)
MTYDKPDNRFDRHSSDKDSGNAGIQTAARDAYEPGNGKMNWNFNTQDTASSSLPQFSLTNGSSGEGAAMQNAAAPGQNPSSLSSGTGDAVSASSASSMPNDGVSAGSLSATPTDAMSGSLSAMPTDAQSGSNQQNLPAEIQQLETGIQQQLLQLSQEITQLETQLGIPSQPGSTSSTPAESTQPATATGTPAESTQPATATGTPAESTQPATATGTPTENQSPTSSQPTAPVSDATIQALQATDPQAAQILTALEPAQSGLTQTGFNQFEGNFNQNIQGGQYPDVASAANAAQNQLQTSGDTGDATIAQSVINNNIAANGDAALSTYNPTPAPATNDNPTPAPATNDNPTPAPAASDNPTPVPAANDSPTPAPAATNNPTPAPATNDNPTSPTATNGNPTTGNFDVVNGQIIGPNGQPFVAKGVAVYASQAQAEASTIVGAMPDLNFIRLASTPSSDTPQDIAADVQAFQSLNPNIVVEVEDHTSGGTDGTTNNTLSGQDLTNEANWYAQVEQATDLPNGQRNPNVIYGTANEPNDPSNEQDVVTQEQAIVAAVDNPQAQLSGANPSPSTNPANDPLVLLEADGGGTFGPQLADPSAYAGMTNVAFDDHYYGWETNGDTSVADNVQALQTEVAGSSSLTESNGASGQQSIPTVIGEYGDSTNGQTVDANGTAAVNAVQTALNDGLVQGAVAWTWNGNNEPNNSDAITQDGTLNTLTPYGQEIINYVNNGTTGSVT